MLLQINNSGAWKNVIRFDEAEIDEVKSLAESLGALDDAASDAGSRCKWRVLGDADRVVWHWAIKKGWLLWVHPGDR